MKLRELGVALGSKKTLRQYKLHQATGNAAARHVTPSEEVAFWCLLMLLGKGVTAAPDPRGHGHRQLGRAASKDTASVQGEEMPKSASWVEAQLTGSTEDQPSPTKLQTQTQPVSPLPSFLWQ